MALQPIIPSVDAASRTKPGAAPDAVAARLACSFCGARAGLWQSPETAPVAGHPVAPAVDLRACPLCTLPQHLERPRIDEEVALVWLPEMSQQAVNATMREIHMQLRTLGEDLHASGAFRNELSPQLRTLHFGRAVLSERVAIAATRIGTGSAHELGLALLELSPAAYARRGGLLGGLRLLPLGRFYDGDTDVYPDIVDAWLKPPHQVEPVKAVTAMPVDGMAQRPRSACLRTFLRRG